MALTNTQIEILQRINKNLRRGDIKDISASTGFSRVTVANTLNPFSPVYNEEVINAATELVVEREQGRKKILKELPAA